MTDPVDGTVASTVPRASEPDVRDAVARARAAAGPWARTAPAERGALLRAAAEHVRAHAQELADLNTRETGKVPGDALGGVEAGVGTLVQYAELGPVHRGEALRGQFGAADWAVPHPRGVVLALTPWNDPVAVALRHPRRSDRHGQHRGAQGQRALPRDLRPPERPARRGPARRRARRRRRGRAPRASCCSPRTASTSTRTSGPPRPETDCARSPSRPVPTWSARTAGTTRSSSTPTSTRSGPPPRWRSARSRTPARSAPASSACTCTATSPSPSSPRWWPRRSVARPHPRTPTVRSSTSGSAAPCSPTSTTPCSAARRLGPAGSPRTVSGRSTRRPCSPAAPTTCS